MHAKRIMWTCRRTAFAFIRLSGVCLVNRQMLSIWSRYIKEKSVRNHTDVDVHSFGQPTNDQRNAYSFACAANAEQATFWSRMPCSHPRTDVDAPLWSTLRLLRGVDHKDRRLAGLITFSSLIPAMLHFEVDKCVRIASKWAIQIKMQYLFTSPPPLSMGSHG